MRLGMRIGVVGQPMSDWAYWDLLPKFNVVSPPPDDPNRWTVTTELGTAFKVQFSKILQDGRSQLALPPLYDPRITHESSIHISLPHVTSRAASCARTALTLCLHKTCLPITTYSLHT